ncbi:MAG: hypothetical protein AAFW00_13445 [Bacteroidota bacterium]
MKTPIHLFLHYLAFTLLCPVMGLSQTFTIPPTTTWTCQEGAYELKGTFANLDMDNIWLCLRDRFDNLYIQYPAISQASFAEWEHLNVRIRGKENLTRIMALSVNRRGHRILEQWEKENRGKGIKLNRLKKILPGFLILDSKSLDGLVGDCVDSPSSPLCLEVRKLEGDIVSLANFDEGGQQKGYLLGGKADYWVSEPTDYQMIIESCAPFSDETRFGSHALKVQFAPTLTESKSTWRGGGLVLLLGPETTCFDISEFRHLEFEMKVMDGISLKEMKIKLEDGSGESNIEIPLKQQGASFSDEWAPIKIPLKAFAQNPFTAPQDRVKANLSQIRALTFIGIQDEFTPLFSGTLLIDNIKISK